MRDPFASRTPRPPFVPEGTSMLAEARLVAARHADQDAKLSDPRSTVGDATEGDDNVEGRKVKAEDRKPSRLHPGQR